MNMTVYFHLAKPQGEGLYADRMKGSPKPEQEIRWCPLTKNKTDGTRHLDGSRRISDLALQVTHNDRRETMIWSWMSECLIHESLLEEFRRAKLTGVRTRPAEVRFKDGVVSRDYNEMVVTGWAGLARPESGIRVEKSCPACHWKTYSPLKNAEEVIDWSQWSGDDFFIVWPMPSYILITERVAELLLRLDVQSLELRGLEDSRRSIVVDGAGFCVARLSNFMPEDLAIKYGRPLGLE